MDMNDETQKELPQIDVENKEEIIVNINLFKQYPAGDVVLGENMGVVANYLAEEPLNQEEKMLIELWESGSKEEQKRLAHTLLEMMWDKNR